MGNRRSSKWNSGCVSDQLIQSWVAQRGRTPMIVSRASGIHIWDTEGRSYADFASGQISVNVGYGRPEIEDAIRRQLDQVAYVAPVYRTEVEIELAAMVVEVTPPALRHVFFTNSGTEGVETAIKIARATTGRSKIYSAWQSYHGSTQGSSAVSGDPRRLFAGPGSCYQPKFLLPNPYRNPFSSHDPETVASAALALLAEQIEFEGPETIAALLIEPMVGTSGLYIPPASFIRGLRTLCDRYEIMLIFDETMTGWGRTGRWFAADHFGVTPDIMVTAKGITSGYIPFGCVVVATEIYEKFLDRPFVAGSTTEGHALGCAAGLANIAVYRKEHLVTRSEQMGKRMIDGLQALKRMHPSVGDVRGCGLFACIELTSDPGSNAPLAGYRDARGEIASRLLNALLDRGVSTIAKWDFLFFAPPLVVEEAQINDALGKLDEALKTIDELVC